MSAKGPAQSESPALLRIGELSRRTGVATDTLRAWERRYGLLRPERSTGGYRLYGNADEDRVHAMQALIAEGLSAAEAAAHLRDRPLPVDPAESAVPAGDLAARLRGALERMDESSANAALDEALAGLSLEFVVDAIVLPVLRELGEDWESERIGVGQEHFASNLLRGRLLGLARGWGGGDGPRVVLACPPGERHDLGLICFGLVMRRRGWRVTLLGADSPVATIADTARSLGADAVVLAATDRQRLEDAREDLRELACEHLVALGGAGAEPALAAAVGATFLASGPVEAGVALDRTARSQVKTRRSDKV
jgi:DNA-binding transcriptional MerR regulator